MPNAKKVEDIVAKLVKSEQFKKLKNAITWPKGSQYAVNGEKIPAKELLIPSLKQESNIGKKMDPVFKEMAGTSLGQGLDVRSEDYQNAKEAALRSLEYLKKQKKPNIPGMPPEKLPGLLPRGLDFPIVQKPAIPRYNPDIPILHEGVGPLAGLGDNTPLEQVYRSTNDLPLTADTPEELSRLKKMMTGTPEEQAALVNEYARQAGASKERQLEEYFAKKQAGEQTGSITDKIFNPEGTSTSFVGKAANALGYPQRKLMNALANKLGASGQTDTNSEKSAQAIVERAASALGVPETSTAGNVAKAFGVAGLEVFGDPTSFLPIGKLAKAAGIAHAAPKIAEESVKKAEAVKKALGLLHAPEQAAEGAKVVQSVLPAVQQDVQKMMSAMKAEEALKVFNHKPTEPTYAQKLLDKGAQQIQPVGKIIKSR